jgi:hypothetical protein
MNYTAFRIRMMIQQSPTFQNLLFLFLIFNFYFLWASRHVSWLVGNDKQKVILYQLAFFYWLMSHQGLKEKLI